MTTRRFQTASVAMAVLIGSTLFFATGYCKGLFTARFKERKALPAPAQLLPDNIPPEATNIRVRIGPIGQEVIYVDPVEGHDTVAVVPSTSSNGKVALDVTIFCHEAIHEIMEPLSLGGYTFKPNKDTKLIFKVDTKKGYVFVSGSGKVVTPKGEEIGLSDKKKGTVVGSPSKTVGNDKGKDKK